MCIQKTWLQSARKCPSLDRSWHRRSNIVSLREGKVRPGFRRCSGSKKPGQNPLPHRNGCPPTTTITIRTSVRSRGTTPACSLRTCSSPTIRASSVWRMASPATPREHPNGVSDRRAAVVDALAREGVELPLFVDHATDPRAQAGSPSSRAFRAPRPVHSRHPPLLRLLADGGPRCHAPPSSPAWENSSGVASDMNVDPAALAPSEEQDLWRQRWRTSGVTALAILLLYPLDRAIVGEWPLDTLGVRLAWGLCLPCPVAPQSRCGRVCGSERAVAAAGVQGSPGRGQAAGEHRKGPPPARCQGRARRRW